MLIDAAAELAGHPRRPLVVVAGEGPAREELAARIRERSAPVRLLGERTDAADLLRAADLAVLPSRWEGSPLAAHEALQAGAPLVATAVGGLPALAAGAAVLVPPGDAAALAAQLRRLLDDPQEARRIGRLGLERAGRWPDAAATVAGVLATYAELLDSPPPESR